MLYGILASFTKNNILLSLVHLMSHRNAQQICLTIHCLCLHTKVTQMKILKSYIIVTYLVRLQQLFQARLLESAGILPFSCQERRGDDSPGWRQARPTAVGWAGSWGCAVTGQLSDSVCRRKWSDQRKFCLFLAFLSCICE